MFFWKLLEIKIMQKSDDSPEFFFLAIAQFSREITHGILNDLRVFQMKCIFIVFC